MEKAGKHHEIGGIPRWITLPEIEDVAAVGTEFVREFDKIKWRSAS